MQLLPGWVAQFLLHATSFTGPEDFSLMVSINVVAVVIVGGMGNIPGVIAGALVLKGLPEALRQLEDYRVLVFGASAGCDDALEARRLDPFLAAKNGD